MSAATDFDFLHGRWTVHHRRLDERGAGSTNWVEFDGTAETRPLIGGQCNIEEHSIPGTDAEGVALRIFNPVSRQWSIHWVSRRSGVLEPPVVGSFEGGIGRFEGSDVDSGRLVQVHFLWHRITPVSARWEQSFFYNSGESRETNWIMDFSRA